jgi:hypothetical protein
MVSKDLSFLADQKHPDMHKLFICCIVSCRYVYNCSTMYRKAPDIIDRYLLVKNNALIFCADIKQTLFTIILQQDLS